LTESVEVGANNLTLDGNGHTLDGQGNCSEGSGIHFNARTTLVIKNFTIKNFCDGMNFTNSISNSILDNTITNNSHEGIFIQNSNDNLISNNVFTNNGYEGLEISYSVDDVISNNVFTDNGEDNAFWALRIHYSDGFTITGNTVSSTSTAQLSGGEQSHDYGIYVEDGGGGDATIENNNISNMYSGMEIRGSGSNHAIIKNNIIDSNWNGIWCDNCEVFSNTISDNENYGLRAYQYVSTHDNTFSGNGVGMTTYSSYHSIFRNTFSNNDHGLQSGGQNVYVSENNFLSNTVQATSPGSNYSNYFDELDNWYWFNPSNTGKSGNYWNDYSHICDDTNADNICDDPYPFSGGTINVDDEFVWTVQDGWLSQITNPGDLALGAADSSGAVGTFSVTATHDGSSMSVTCDTASGITFPIGNSTVTCTATNGIKTAFTVSVSLDSTSPTVSVPSNITVVSPDNSGLAVTYDVTATDDFAVTTGPTCTPASGSTFAVGDTTVTCTASDAAGNVGTQTFTVTNNVEDVSPVVTVPDDMIISLAQGETETTTEFSFSATDNFAVTVGPTCTPASGSTFAIGNSTITCTAADAAGNVGTESFVVSIVEYDTTPPVVTVPSDITVYEIASNVGAVSTFSVSATDNVAVTTGPTCSPISGATFSVGDNTVTCTAEDANGNVGTATFVVTVVEYTPPTVDAANARIVDAFGSTVSDVLPGQQVQIATDISWDGSTDQEFAYWIDITGPVIDEMWITGSLAAGQSMSPALSWTPISPGDYIILIYLYDSADDKNLLSTPLTLQINIPSQAELPTSATVTNAPGSATPGCEPNCFVPTVVTIGAGGTITWQNTDNAAHTATGGTPTDGPDGVFDSSLVMVGGSYSHTFDTPGAYQYFCMVHPWMTGIVLVGGSAEVPPEAEPPVNISIGIGNAEYNLNEIITVSVNLGNISDNQQVIIDVLDPEGTHVVTRAMTVSPNSSSSIDFKVSENSLTGNYKIVASTTSGVTTVTESIYFKIKSQYNQFQIASVEVTDQQGNSSTLNRGEMGYIKVILTSDISIEPLVTVNLFDAELTTLGVGSVKSPLSQGESEIILSFLIPDDAVLGDADIFVNAFTNWVSSGGIPLTPEFSITAEISP